MGSARGHGCALRRPDKAPLIDQSYAPDQVGDVGAALVTAGAWLRDTQNLEPVAVGHRVVHGGPDYDRPVLIDSKVLTDLERYVSLAPLHQPNNLAPVRAILARMPGLPQVACLRSTVATAPLRTIMRYPSGSTRKACAATVSTACPMNLLRAACRM